MSEKEKSGWFAVALYAALLILFLHTITAWIPGENAAAGRVSYVIATGVVTLFYLLVLSWRAAYLSGRKRGR